MTKQDRSSQENSGDFDRTIKITKLFDSPTFAIYSELQGAYQNFNDELFSGELPPCMLTLYHHSNRTLGYFRPNGFTNSESGVVTDEIALNPMIFDSIELSYVLSILVHEMAHLWRYHFGEPKHKVNGYHDKVWGKKMESIGLVPSNTGFPGGEKTGFQMMHYIAEGGLFEHVCDNFIKSGFALTWAYIQQIHLGNQPDHKDTPEKKEERRKAAQKRQKTKFVCPICNACVWGKPTTNVICGQDRVNMLEAKK